MNAVFPVTIAIRRPGEQPRTLMIAESPFVFGRSESAAFSVTEDTLLSRLHFVLECEGGYWRVRDLGSRNGTEVNGQPISEARILAPGDVIVAGRLSVTYDPNRPPTPEAKKETAFQFVEDLAAPIHPSSTVVLRVENAQLDRVSSEPGMLNALRRRVDVLVRAGKELARFQPLDEIFRTILDLSLMAVQAQRGMLMILENGELLPRATRGEGFRIAAAVRDKVMNERSSLLVQDTSIDEALRASRTIMQQQTRSLLAVPLHTEAAVTGLLYVDSPGLIRNFDADDLTLLTVLGNIAAVRLEQARLQEIEQNERLIARELEQAFEIQKGLLPQSLPAMPGIEVSARSVPCKTIGGDYYDVLEMADGRMGFVVADVAGKGLSAALVMSNLQARVQALYEAEPDLARLVSKLNHSLRANTPDNRFITGFFAMLDPKTGRIDYSNAGHNPPILVRASGSTELLSVGGPVLGILQNIPYVHGTAYLEPGDRLVLYTDGVSEANNPSDEEFGEETIRQIAAGCADRSATETLLEIGRQLRLFLNGRALGDDMTLMVVARH